MVVATPVMLKSWGKLRFECSTHGTKANAFLFQAVGAYLPCPDVGVHFLHGRKGPMNTMFPKCEARPVLWQTPYSLQLFSCGLFHNRLHLMMWNQCLVRKSANPILVSFSSHPEPHGRQDERNYVKKKMWKMVVLRHLKCFKADRRSRPDWSGDWTNPWKNTSQFGLLFVLFFHQTAASNLRVVF